MLRSSEPLYAELNSSDTTLGIPLSNPHLQRLSPLERYRLIGSRSLVNDTCFSEKSLGRNSSPNELFCRYLLGEIEGDAVDRAWSMSKGLLDMQLLRPLMRALALHQKRWEKITIVLKRHSGTIILDEADYTPSPGYPPSRGRSEAAQNALLEVCLMVSSRRIDLLILRGPPSLRCEVGQRCYRLVTPGTKNSETLSYWQPRHGPDTRFRRDYHGEAAHHRRPNEYTPPPSVPQRWKKLYSGSIISKRIINDLPHFRDFICRNVSPLRALSILSISLWMSMSVFPEYLMLVPKITSLSLDCMSRRSYAFKFLKLLSERATNGDTETVSCPPYIRAPEAH